MYRIAKGKDEPTPKPNGKEKSNCLGKGSLNLI